jgi:hypothetical protein
MPPSYSRRRPKSKGDIVERTERVSRNPVTGEIERVELDGVQLIFEATVRAMEAAFARHKTTTADLERLADMLAFLAVRTKRHTDADLDAMRALLAAMNGRGGAK